MAKNKQTEKYAHLDLLSTEQLEELLRVEFASSTQQNEEMVWHILEVLENRERKEPVGRLPDVEQAWSEFRAYYDIPEGEGRSLYPDDCRYTPRSGPNVFQSKVMEVFRTCGVVAVIMMVIFGGMLAGEACGFEAFASLGLWVNESTISYSPDFLGTYMWK